MPRFAPVTELLVSSLKQSNEFKKLTGNDFSGKTDLSLRGDFFGDGHCDVKGVYVTIK